MSVTGPLARHSIDNAANVLFQEFYLQYSLLRNEMKREALNRGLK